MKRSELGNPRWALHVIVASFLAGGAVHAQVLTENAGVISPATPTVRKALRFRETENLTDLRLNHQLIVGVNPTTELRLTVPTIISRRADVPGFFRARETVETAGLGDVSLQLKYSLYQVDDVMESTRWAALMEVVAPTGDDDERSGGRRLPRRFQAGPGSWGYGFGTAYTLIRDRHRFSTDLYYRHRTRHEGFRPGPSLHWDAAYWYRLRPAQHPPPDKEVTEIRGVIELLTEYRFESGAGQRGAGDEGLEVWLAPGIQIYPRRDVLTELSFPIPVVQSINDDLGDRRWGFVIAVKFLF